MRTKLERRLGLALAPVAWLASSSIALAQPQDVTDFAPIPPVCAPDEDPATGCRFQTLSPDGTKTIAKTGSAERLGLFEQSFPFGEDATAPSNMFPTVYRNIKDSAGNEIPNTLPSTPEDPYALHPDPEVSDIVHINGPEDDLDLLIKRFEEATNRRIQVATNQTRFRGGVGVPVDPRRGDANSKDPDSGLLEAATSIDPAELQMAIDILEGNPVPNRAYSGMPLLNYKGAEQVKVVDGETKTVEVRQVWTRAAIMSDTMFIDPSAVLDDTWTIHYVVDVVDRGHEDWAPFVMYFDDPALRNGMGVPNVAFDASFFPMEEGFRYVFDLAMAPGKFYNLTYHWGWRIHPTRIQAVENARKTAGGRPLASFENEVFCIETEEVFNDEGALVDVKCLRGPSDDEEAKLFAIGQIGDLAPAKRMWNALRQLQRLEALPGNRLGQKRQAVEEARAAFTDWQDRNTLPSGIRPDPDADLTMVYLNNTIYGEFPEILRNGQQNWEDWQTRGETLNVKLYNGDYFPHAYINIDFGGLRGWENIYHNTLPLFGQGPWFTFGRVNWLPNLVNPTMVPAAERPSPLAPGYRKVRERFDAASYASDMGKARRMVASSGKGGVIPPELLFASRPSALKRTLRGLGEHEVELEFRFDPAQRLRFYQFDPLHHNVAIWSSH